MASAFLVWGCKTSPSVSAGGSPAAGDSHEVETPVKHVPLAVSQSLRVVVDTGASVSFELMASTTHQDAELTYEVRTQPAHGVLTGAGKSWVYTPVAGYRGADSLTYVVSDGGDVSDVATVSFEMSPWTVYLRADGNDATALGDNSAKPYATAQAAFNAALAHLPSAERPVLIDVGDAGVGSDFGPIVVTANLAAGVIWKGLGYDYSKIGNVSANGAAGITAAECTSGSKGFDLVISGEGGVSFGNISSVGGNAGEGETCVAGNGGTVLISGPVKIASATVNGGGGSTSHTLEYLGGFGGDITLGSEATSIGSITANGGTPNADNNGTAGAGGTVRIFGTAGAVSANGGNSPSTSGGFGGTVVISGSVGNVTANAGDSNSDYGRGGGSITVLAGGTAGTLQAIGAPGGGGGTVVVAGTATSVSVDSVGSPMGGGGGGSATVSATGVVSGAVTANGGFGNGGTGGPGGSITVAGVAGNLSARGSGGYYVSSGAGGTISVLTGATVGDVDASGGSDDQGGSSPAGAGGTVTIAGSSGNVNASGGNGGSDGGATAAGVGGLIKVLAGGHAANLDANGGSDIFHNGGLGGTIKLYAGSVASAVRAQGGDSPPQPDWGEPGKWGGAGGTIIFSPTSTSISRSVAGGVGGAGNGAPGTLTNANPI